jgi:KaiC/GvpD/RAD55 family RecA-like ATPase
VSGTAYAYHPLTFPKKMIQLRKAERKQAKLRISLSGVPGSGKTYSALLLAKGLCGDWSKVALIDTENKRGDLYSDLGPYNIVTLEPDFTPEKYIEYIEACEQAGMQVIVIDSMSHEWDGKGGLLEANEKTAATRFKGNTWAAWGVSKPRHQRFIDKIIQSPCHIIGTMRSKIETIQTEDKKIKKVGMKDIQKDDTAYEMTITFNIEREGHYAVPEKDNTHLFDKRDPFIIAEKDGEAIKKWNESGAVVPVDYSKIKEQIFDNLVRIGQKPETKEQAEAIIKKITKLALTEKNYEKILDRLHVVESESKKVEEKQDLSARIKSKMAKVAA